MNAKRTISRWWEDYGETQRKNKELLGMNLSNLPGKVRHIKKMWDLLPPDIRRQQFKDATFQLVVQLFLLMVIMYVICFVWRP